MRPLYPFGGNRKKSLFASHNKVNIIHDISSHLAHELLPDEYITGENVI